jgi:hypothetical protein
MRLSIPGVDRRVHQSALAFGSSPKRNERSTERRTFSSLLPDLCALAIAGLHNPSAEAKPWTYRD